MNSPSQCRSGICPYGLWSGWLHGCPWGRAVPWGRDPLVSVPRVIDIVCMMDHILILLTYFTPAKARTNLAGSALALSSKYVSLIWLMVLVVMSSDSNCFGTETCTLTRSGQMGLDWLGRYGETIMCRTIDS